MAKTLKKKLRKTKRNYRGGYRNKRKKTKKIKRKLKGGGDKLEKINSFKTNISFFMVLFYLKTSDNNSYLDTYRGSDKLPVDKYRDYMNKKDINEDVLYFHKYVIKELSEFSFKYDNKYSYYKLSVKDKFVFMSNPQNIFNFNNYHAIVGYNHNIGMNSRKINELSDFANAEKGTLSKAPTKTL